MRPENPDSATTAGRGFGWIDFEAPREPWHRLVPYAVTIRAAKRRIGTSRRGGVMAEITDLLAKARSHDREAKDRLVALLYPDLHRMAQGRLARNAPITLLDTTSMVHETYLRLHNAGRIDAESRGQFMAYIAQVMRSVIVDFARKRRAGRRGGGAADVTLTTELIEGVLATDDEIERINDALLELESSDPRLKQIVEMRFFVGLSEAEIAEALGITDRTVRRDWQRAKMLLSVSLKR